MYEDTKRKLNQISESACLAKWYQSTILLYSGQTHSCHHPPKHTIPLDSLETPSNLHDTPKKLLERQDMLSGKRPKGCSYCWKLEDIGQDSDRFIKSNDFMSDGRIKQIQDLSVNPAYLEVAFDVTCNLKCSYCSPASSSKWIEEIKEHGPYKIQTFSYNSLEEMKSLNRMPYLNREHNPYIEAFWKWFPDLLPNLETFRVTGGEPLLSKDFWLLFDKIDTYYPNLTFSFNSNMSVDTEIVNKCIDKFSNLPVKQKEVYISIESVGKQAEYSRYGLDYNLFLNNVNAILKSNVFDTIVFVMTVNIFSITTLTKMLSNILQFKKEYAQNKGKVEISLPYLSQPRFLDIRIAPYSEILKLIYGLTALLDNDLFSNYEKNLIERIVEYLKVRLDKEDQESRLGFFRDFINEYDKRRNTNFIQTFPELKSMV